MSEVASLRLGTLEITAALAAVALVSGRRHPRPSIGPGRRLPVEVILGISERGAHRTYAGLAPLDIGREAEASLVLADPEVSRRHARLEAVDGIIFICDLESSNGTFLNGSRVTSPIEVRVGDEIDVGATRLTVEDLKLWT